MIPGQLQRSPFQHHLSSVPSKHARSLTGPVSMNLGISGAGKYECSPVGKTESTCSTFSDGDRFQSLDRRQMKKGKMDRNNNLVLPQDSESSNNDNNSSQEIQMTPRHLPGAKTKSSRSLFSPLRRSSLTSNPSTSEDSSTRPSFIQTTNFTDVLKLGKDFAVGLQSTFKRLTSSSRGSRKNSESQKSDQPTPNRQSKKGLISSQSSQSFGGSDRVSRSHSRKALKQTRSAQTAQRPQSLVTSVNHSGKSSIDNIFDHNALLSPTFQKQILNGTYSPYETATTNTTASSDCQNRVPSLSPSPQNLPTYYEPAAELPAAVPSPEGYDLRAEMLKLKQMEGYNEAFHEVERLIAQGDFQTTHNTRPGPSEGGECPLLEKTTFNHDRASNADFKHVLTVLPNLVEYYLYEQTHAGDSENSYHSHELS